MKGYFAALVFLLSCANAFAANHYIRAGATGANNGSSWINAWTTFGAVTWTRGDTYYVAGGTYNGNVTIPTGESGSLWITVKKANAGDNGSDPGWEVAYATTQAVINGKVVVSAGYVEVDGVTGSGESGHGIKVYAATGSGAVFQFNSGASPRHLHHVEIQGPGFTWPSTVDGLYYNSLASATKGFHVSYCWIHEVSRNGVVTGSTVGTSYTDFGMLFENNVVSETGGVTNGDHGQGMQIAYALADAYTIIRNNIFRNIVGSGFICFLGAATHSQSRIYNNVFYITDLSAYNVCSPGVIATWSSSFNDIYIYNNTFYGIGSAATGNVRAEISNQSSGSANVVVENNLWVNSRFGAASYGTTVKSNNDFYANFGAAPRGETNQVTESANPFVDSAGYDFRLSCTANAGRAGADLSSVFSSDILGTVHPTSSWAIGAYRCYDGAAPPVAPSNVKIVR